MTYTEPVRRVDSTTRFGKPTHHYVDGGGQRIPGVTTLLSEGMPKPALVGWGIKSVAEYAIDHWDELADAEISERLKTLKGAPYADRDKAARRGTEVHALAEQLVNGEEVDVPPELAGHVASYVDFLDTWKPEPVLVEATVYNLKIGFAGTLDLIARVPDGRTLLMDLKTNRSGIYGETAYQLALYRAATHYIDADGNAQPMIEVDDVVVVHVRADGYDVVPLRCDEQVLLEARYIARVALASKNCRGYVGDPLLAPEAVSA